MRLLLLLCLLMANQQAFAVASDCKNPVDVPLDGQIKMRFCEILAAKNFQIGQFEVSQIQFVTVTGARPWQTEPFKYNVVHLISEKDDNPAAYISYYRAMEFAHIMNLLDKTATYRLPTEAEFEFATRAGTTTEFYWGDKADKDFANFDYWGKKKSGAIRVDSCPNSERESREPGYCANGFGLYHMVGNVMEWTTDIYPEPVEKEVSWREYWRVLRGGSWYSSAKSARSSARRGEAPYVTDFVTGFRLVRIPKENQQPQETL